MYPSFIFWSPRFFGLESMHRAHSFSDHWSRETKLTVFEMHKNITQGKMAIKLISGTTCYALTYIEF